MQTQPRTTPFRDGLFDEIRINADALRIIELENALKQKDNTIRGLKSFHTKLIRTLNKNN